MILPLLVFPAVAYVTIPARLGWNFHYLVNNRLVIPNDIIRGTGQLGTKMTSLGGKPWTSKKDRLINGTYHLPCLSRQYCQWPEQKLSEKQALAAGTKQSKQANKADGLTRKAASPRGQSNMFVFVSSQTNTC